MKRRSFIQGILAAVGVAFTGLKIAEPTAPKVYYANQVGIGGRRWIFDPTIPRDTVYIIRAGTWDNYNALGYRVDGEGKVWDIVNPKGNYARSTF